jgi:hypothetical protein
MERAESGSIKEWMTECPFWPDKDCSKNRRRYIDEGYA